MKQPYNWSNMRTCSSETSSRVGKEVHPLSPVSTTCMIGMWKGRDHHPFCGNNKPSLPVVGDSGCLYHFLIIYQRSPPIGNVNGSTNSYASSSKLLSKLRLNQVHPFWLMTNKGLVKVWNVFGTLLKASPNLLCWLWWWSSECSWQLVTVLSGQCERPLFCNKQ